MNKEILKKLDDCFLAIAAEKGAKKVTYLEVCTAADVNTGSFRNFTGMTWPEFLGRHSSHLEADPQQLGTSKAASSDIRRMDFVRTGLKIAEAEGLHKVTASSVCREAEVSRTLFHSCMKTDDLIAEVIKLAVVEQNLPVLACALARRHPATEGASKSLINRALASLK